VLTAGLLSVQRMLASVAICWRSEISAEDATSALAWQPALTHPDQFRVLLGV
jgi:hypothetical protein